jgi:O-antigen ligase
MSVDAIPIQRPGLLLASLAAVAALIGAAAVGSPPLVFVGTLGVVFVALAFQNLSAGLAIFTVLIFLEQIPTISSAGLTLSKLGGGVLAIAWLVAVTKPDSDVPFLGHRHPVLAYSALVLLCWTLASMLWAPDPSVAGLTALRFGQGILLLFIVFAAISERRHLTWVVYAFVAGATLTAVIGLGGATQTEGAGVAASGRLAGGIGDPNDLAAILIPALGFTLFMLLAKKGALLRCLLLAAAITCAVALFQTESRGGLVGLAVMLLASVVFSGPVRAKAVTMVLAVLGFTLAYFTLIASPEALARVTDFSAGGGTGRPDIWAVAVAVSRNHPLGGVGAGNFILVEPSYAFGNINLTRFDLIVDTPKVVHNMYLNILAELGVVGFILFAVVILAAFVAAFRAVGIFARAGDTETEILARGIIIGTIGMLAAFFFLSAQYDKQLPLLLGVLVALATLARVRSTQQAAE